MSKITVTTIAGLTSGGDANTVKIESGDTLAVQTNATVGGTLGVTGNTTMGGTAAITGNTTITGDLAVDTNVLKVDTSNNRVGIGATSPYKPLTIMGAIGGTKSDLLDLQSSNSGGGTQPMIRFGTEAANANTIGRCGFIDIPNYGGGFVVETNSTGGATHTTTEKFRIDKDGKVGIGTTAPLRQLHIHNTSANSEIAFTAGTSGVSSILFGDGQTGTDVYRGYIQYQHSSDTLLLATSAISRLTIDDAGRFRVPTVYSSTTGAGANVNVASDGRFERSTSSLRYKNTIKDATHGLTDLLKLRSITYKGNNDGDTVFGGLIAEEVHDAGLTEFVQYDDDNKPDALAYGNMVSLCIKAIQELSAKNDALETKVKALESK